MKYVNNNEMGNLLIAIGGFSIALKFDNLDFLEENKGKISNFIVENEDYHIKVEVEYFEEFRRFDPPLKIPKINFNPLNKNYNILGNGFEGEFNIDKMHGFVRCSMYLGVHSFLRIILPLILLKKKGFFVHASSLIRNNKGYMFPGKSEAGKTTITRLTPEAIILTDELSIVCKVKGCFKLFGTPFSSELSVMGENTSVIIDKMLFPIKDNKNYVKELGNLKALEMLLPHVVLYNYDNEMEKELFDLCYEFVSEISSNELHFLPESTFWRYIDAE